MPNARMGRDCRIAFITDTSADRRSDWNDLIDTIPREKTKDPTPISIFRQLILARELTKLVPNVSHFPCIRGKIGKSTASIQ